MGPGWDAKRLIAAVRQVGGEARWSRVENEALGEASARRLGAVWRT